MRMKKSYCCSKLGEGKLQSHIQGKLSKIQRGKNKWGMAQISEHKAEHKIEQIIMSSTATLKWAITRPGEFELTDLCS